MTRQTDGMPELNYSEEVFRDMYEALKELLHKYRLVRGQIFGADQWEDAARQALAKADKK